MKKVSKVQAKARKCVKVAAGRIRKSISANKPSPKKPPPKKPAARLVVNKKKRTSGTAMSKGTTKTPSPPSTPRPAPPKKMVGKALACRKKGLKKVIPGEPVMSQTAGMRDPLPVGSLCYTWSESHRQLFNGYIVGLGTVSGRPTRMVKYFGVGDSKYKLLFILLAFRSFIEITYNLNVFS